VLLFVSSLSRRCLVPATAGNASPHIQNLAPINALLAHQPWRVTAEMILELTRKAPPSPTNRRRDGSHSAKPWLMSHLVHALAIICQYHMVSAIVLALGVSLDADMVTMDDVADQFLRADSPCAMSVDQCRAESEGAPTLKEFLLQQKSLQGCAVPTSQSDKMAAFKRAVSLSSQPGGGATESEASDSDVATASSFNGRRREKSMSGSSWSAPDSVHSRREKSFSGTFLSSGTNTSGSPTSSSSSRSGSDPVPVSIAMRENAWAVESLDAQLREKLSKAAAASKKAGDTTHGGAESAQGAEPAQGAESAQAVANDAPNAAVSADGASATPPLSAVVRPAAEQHGVLHGRYSGSTPLAPLCYRASDFFKSKDATKRKFKVCLLLERCVGLSARQYCHLLTPGYF